MTGQQIGELFAVLAWVGTVIGVATVVALVVPGLRLRLLEAVGAQVLPVGWLVAAVATAGSLTLSEVAHFNPCRLCIYQRIAMYPLVVVLGVGALARTANARAVARLVAAVLALGGLTVNLWHVAVEIRPTLEGDSCDPLNPCSLLWVDHALGIWTIPRMATVAFVLVLLALVVDLLADRPATQEPRPA